MRFDAERGLDRLVTLPVSRAAAEQRAGRAGRLEAGVCYRLWSEHRHLSPAGVAEILQADLAPLVLELGALGCADCRPAALAGHAPGRAYGPGDQSL